MLLQDEEVSLSNLVTYHENRLLGPVSFSFVLLEGFVPEARLDTGGSPCTGTPEVLSKNILLWKCDLMKEEANVL